MLRDIEYEGGGNERHVLVEQAVEPERVPDVNVVGYEHCVHVGEEGVGEVSMGAWEGGWMDVWVCINALLSVC